MALSSATSNPQAERPGEIPPESVVFGISPAMQVVRQKVLKAAGANVPVLIQGESGTGKEVLAQFIHSRSAWNTGPFVKVNCAAIPGTLLESELFGYEKGAFTGAYASKPGRVELAHRGTLFLDEIAELDPALQAKLLQVVQDGQFCRIGAQEDKHVEAHVICATNRDLESEIEAGNFRADLFYRINVIQIHMPLLQERAEDIPVLANYFLSSFNAHFHRNAPPLSKKTMQMFQHRQWPGNIRELENLIKRYVILGLEETASSEFPRLGYAQPNADTSADGSISLKNVTRQAVQELERRIILRALETNKWNRKRVARSLSISYRALLYKMRQAGISSKTTRSQPGALAASPPPAD